MLKNIRCHRIHIILQTKDFLPGYIYESGIEIDFLYPDGTLVEAKFGGELTEKQLRFFESFDAKQRMVVTSLDDLDRLREDLQKRK